MRILQTGMSKSKDRFPPPCSGAEQSVYLSKGAVSRVVIMKYEITNGALLGKQVHVETCSFYFQEAFFFSAI